MATRIPPSLKRLNLTAIMARVQREQGWTAAEAGDAELWYRRFLQLSLERGSKPFYAITEQADHVWHAHILFTRKYRQDCERIFGGYLDHTPADKGPDSLSKERQRQAAALYFKVFAVALDAEGACPALLPLAGRRKRDLQPLTVRSDFLGGPAVSLWPRG